jgi:Holliday junction resolvase
MRRAAHVDANQAEIVNALVSAGLTVQSLAGIGAGCPDILVGGPGLLVLMEIKNRDGENGRVARGQILTDDQKKWHKWWKGPVYIVCTPQEALMVVSGVQLPA